MLYYTHLARIHRISTRIRSTAGSLKTKCYEHYNTNNNKCIVALGCNETKKKKNKYNNKIFGATWFLFPPPMLPFTRVLSDMSTEIWHS